MPTSLSSKLSESTAVAQGPTIRQAVADTTEFPYGGRLMFTQSWEDPACDLRALCPKSGDVLFAITSGADNVLEFLLSDPAFVLAVDLNPTQNYLFELKAAGFATLRHAELLQLLGVHDPACAWDLYRQCRSRLSVPARQFWDERRVYFDRGLLLQGGFERYFAVLRSVLKVLVGGSSMRALFGLAPAEQEAFFAKHWNTRRYRWTLRALCSKWFLSRRLDPSWFDDSEQESFGAHFEALARHALVELPASSNYFLAQILQGRYLGEWVVPRYLLPENFSVIRDRLSRVTLLTLDVLEALKRQADASVDAFALSNVFEYAPVQLFDACKGELLRCAKPTARLCLRNLLASRRLGDDPRFVVDAVLSHELQRADRAFIYSRFEAARIADRPRLPTT